MSVRKSTLANFLLGYANILFVFINSIILVPLYFLHFDLHTYGSWLASGNIISMIGMVEGGIGIVATQTLSARWGMNEKKLFAIDFGSVLLIAISISIIFYIFLLIFCPFIPAWVKAKTSDTASLLLAIKITGLSVAFVFLQSAFTSANAAFHNYHKVAIINLFGMIIGIASNFISLLVFKMGIVSIAISNLSRASFILIGVVYITHEYWKSNKLPNPAFIRSNIMQLLRKMSALFSSRIFASLLDNSQEFFITALINPSAAAVVSINTRLFGMVKMLMSPVYQAVYPLLSQFTNHKENFQNIVDGFRLVYQPLCIVACSIAIVLNGPFINLWVGSDKNGGLILSVILAINTFLWLKLNSMWSIANSMGKFSVTSAASILDGIIRISLLAVVYFSNVPRETYTIPLIECCTLTTLMVVATFYFHKHIYKEETSSVKSSFTFLLNLFFCFLLAVFIAKVNTLFSHSWVHLVLLGVILLSLFTILNFYKLQQRTLLKYFYSTIKQGGK